MILTQERRQFRPRKAHSVEETGLPPNLVLDLVLKHAYFEGTATLAKLAQKTKLDSSIVHSIYRTLQKERLCETRAMVQDDYEIFLSARGREMAEIALKKSHYAGPAPVPLNDYNQSVSDQTITVQINADILKSSLSDLVLPADVIHQLGTALVTGGAIVLYGSTGNGKTSIAERLHRLWNGFIYVPYAVEIAGHILTVYDPLVHRAEPQDGEWEHSPWVLCRRPMVKVGGELEADMLDPRTDEVTRIGTSPIQMKANNGILLVDDFGRQRITPRELLNRWIVPLDRHTDILSLSSGFSFEVPFQVLVVFATNLPLSDLAEDAFMRRLKNKIKVEPLGTDLFKELLCRVCAEKGMTCSPEIENQIIEECQRKSPDGLRACFPIDLMSVIAGMSKFEQHDPVLNRAEVERALKLYFVH
jgi:predicted ATPase with chaperone activity